MKLPVLRSAAAHREFLTVSVFLLSLALCSLLGCGGSSTSSSTSLKPQAVPPSITAQPQSQTVTEPAAATFSVQATGTAPLVYQWKRGASPITGGTSATYTLPATSAGDTGASFTVTVTNSAGSVTSAAAVLTINLSPASVAAIAGGGQSATISTAFAASLQATVTNSSGIPIANELVTFSGPSSGAGVTFANGMTSTTSATDINGMATASTLTANGVAGSYVVTATVAGLSGSATFNLSNVPPTSGGSGIPQLSHVFIVLEENYGYTDVIGNASMPYLNSLASANSLATQYYADAHPSLPDYFELTVGAGTSITGASGDSFNGVITQNNVVRALSGAGKSWKSYAESLPSVGYLGGNDGLYVKRHNPFVYFSDVQQNSAQASNLVPFTQLATDLANGALPDYGFIVPNLVNDAHDCPAGMNTCTDAQKLAAADQWLSTNISPLLASVAFQNSLLIIVFDEAQNSDTAYGGGRIAAVLVSPLVRAGYQSTTFYQHASILRLMMKALGVADLPGSAATAPDMTEFFP